MAMMSAKSHNTLRHWFHT